jgi:hypothetical protein
MRGKPPAFRRPKSIGARLEGLAPRCSRSRGGCCYIRLLASADRTGMYSDAV